MSGGETYKGGADGGGGRAKGKTKAGRHSRTPSETWPLKTERTQKEIAIVKLSLTEIDDFLKQIHQTIKITCGNETDHLGFVYN